MTVIGVLALAAGVGQAGEVGSGAAAIPQGRHVLVDGRLSAREWTDGLEVALGSSMRLAVKRDQTFLYLAVIPEDGSLFSVDLFFDEVGAGVLNLHASAKLGERTGRFGGWPEWDWWNNRGWAANVVRPESFDPLKFRPDEAKEFQVELARLPSTILRLSLDVQDGERVDSLPATGRTHHERRWLELRL